MSLTWRSRGNLVNILSYLFKKPQTGDKGSVFWPALEEDIQKMNDHTHNGSNSSRLVGSSISATTQAITAGVWVPVVVGSLYRQQVTLPGTMLYDDYLIVFKDQATPKSQLFLSTEKISSNSYYVFINDSSKSITAYYLS